MRHEASFLRDILSAARKIEAITAATPKSYSLAMRFCRRQSSII
jgi:hypothetical protein